MKTVPAAKSSGSGPKKCRKLAKTFEAAQETNMHAELKTNYRGYCKGLSQAGSKQLGSEEAFARQFEDRNSPYIAQEQTGNEELHQERPWCSNDKLEAGYDDDDKAYQRIRLPWRITNAFLSQERGSQLP